MNYFGRFAGQDAAVETVETQVWWSRREQVYEKEEVIDSTAVDAANTPTTQLRAGLIMGRQTSDGNLYAWDPDAVDGTEVVYGVLMYDLDMLDATGTATDRHMTIMVGGPVKASALKVQGTALTSSAAEHAARAQLKALGFVFDDRRPPNVGMVPPPVISVTETGTAVTLTAETHNGKIVCCSNVAAITVALPALEPGLDFTLLRTANEEWVISSAAGDDVIVANDVAADSLTNTTAGEQIGAAYRFRSFHVGTTLKWWATVEHSPFGTNTGTGLTMAIAT